MARYLVRRILQMIPTVLGVLLITFVLFNVVGGSPASMVLGEHVSASALEAFDEQRGFNKPLILGRWARTRAWPDDAAAEPRIWARGEHVLPLRFALRPHTRYRLILQARAGSHSSPLHEDQKSWRAELSAFAQALRRISCDAEKFPIAAKAGQVFGKITLKSFQCLEKTEAEFSKHWKKLSLDLETPAAPAEALSFEVVGAPLEVRSIRLRRRMDSVFDTQFFFFLRQIARLDFGVSSSLNQPVIRLLAQGIGPSLALTCPILAFELVFAVGLALLCAFFRDHWLDRFFVVFAVALMSVNYLVWIVAGQYVLGFRLGWFPVWGFESWRYLLLPVGIGVISGLGSSLRFYRTIALDEMHKGYVRTAFAKGVSRSGVLFRHVLKNALIPIITNVVIALPYLYTGSLLLESFFGIPGLGYLGVNAVHSSDVDVVRAIVLIGSVLYVATNLLTDVAYALVDPRVKFE